MMELIPEVKKEMNNFFEIALKSGFWTSAGKNPFWINVVGDQVFWLGMNSKSEENDLGENWCHVGYGKITGNKIILNWSDIPVGKDRLNGTITIEIINETKMTVVDDSGDFGKSEWMWKSDSQNFSEL
ncbi:hypothetical protein [Maribellus maritimus]|uniref:hypothetical protein n=1 Tax=Maribellus maritimus TaxID=2870838 RepID=UPI001EEC79D6|nr:hypothetical protein [Maribellus maritimus]MCG6190024.1 hypothetical protein [Maribellus maritimus]